jgi:cell division protein FtsW
VIGEELGLLGALTVIGLWLGIYILGLRLLERLARGSFAHNAGFVLLTQLMLQVALNVAVVTAMVPPKGIPHPLLSYGGSNLVVSLAAIGIVLSLTRDSAPAGLAPVER